jgi:hypothetical protein|tara:strand:+ start:990 stop:1637 length:648 start_codon:yes stop_codon:yes gene_type:complete
MSQTIISKPITAWIHKRVIPSSRNPVWNGKTINTRRVVEIGEPFYWTKQTPMTEDDDITILEIMKLSLGIESKYNSCLVNVYEDNAGISYHCDDVTNLVPGSSVLSVSFDLGAEEMFAGEGKSSVLGLMTFKKEVEGGAEMEKIKIRHGRVIVFDPFKDKQNNRQHKATTNKGVKRINFTFRRVKENEVFRCCQCGDEMKEDEEWCDDCWDEDEE